MSELDRTQDSSKETIPYVVLARKYRPKTFDDLIGQEVMVRTLRNGFAMGRIAQAYMLTGVRGIGKTTTARILARALNHRTDGGPNEPSLDMAELGVHCQAIMESRHVDVLEMDAASNTGIDDIREIIEAVRYKPASARYRVFIIDEVHMLSKSAFNGLLKTLEEPPPHVKFIFATTEIRKVPVTILSRCQRFDLRRVTPERLASHFETILRMEAQSADHDALMILARAAEGSVRDGLSLLDQALSLGSGHVTAALVLEMLGVAGRGAILDLLRVIAQSDTAKALEALTKLYDAGCDPAMIVTDLAEAVHTVSRHKAVSDEFPVDFTDADRASAEFLSSQLGVSRLATLWQMLLKGAEEVARAGRPFAALEMLVIRVCYATTLPSPVDSAERLAGVERKSVGSQGLPAANDGGRPSASVTQISARTGPQARATQPAAKVEEAVALPQASATKIFVVFADLVAHVAQVRDVRLKVALEEQVEVVQFGKNLIELHLLPSAPSGLAQDLARKLKTWTGERWVVSISEERGQRTVGDVKRENDAKILLDVRKHPTVKNVMHHFPQATIKAVRPIED